MEFQPRRQVGRAARRSILPTLLWLSVAAGLFVVIPERAWGLKYDVLLALGAIGVWRYAWQACNGLRSYYYGAWFFPRLRREADALPQKYPRRLYFVIASYKESYHIQQLCFQSLVKSCRDLPAQVTAVVSVGSREEVRQIRDIVASQEGGDRLRLVFTYQNHGKRLALGYALRAVARDYHDPLHWHADAANDLVVLMDGDTALGADVLHKCLPFFRLKPNVGAVTTNEIPVVFRSVSEVVRAWYDLKMIRRHHIMKSHSLSQKVLTLTGRFSVFRAGIATSEEFIRFLDRDHVHSWLHGTIRFLMGDDKSTNYCLFKNGWDMLYVPDAYIYCLEDRANASFKLMSLLLFRWYGNMLRNNARCLQLGVSRMPAFIWLGFLDQRVSMWTALLGPAAALLLGLTVSGYYLAFYLIWVMCTRLIQLWALVLQGHAVKPIDLPLIVFEQWYGSLIKVYCLFNLHKQVWQKARSQARTVTSAPRSVRAALSPALLALYGVAFVLAVGLLSGAFKLPTLL